MFNKSGRHIKEPFYYKNERKENMSYTFIYLESIFQASGLFKYAKEELLNKSLKASHKLYRCLFGTEASFKSNKYIYSITL